MKLFNRSGDRLHHIFVTTRELRQLILARREAKHARQFNTRFPPGVTMPIENALVFDPLNVKMPAFDALQGDEAREDIARVRREKGIVPAPAPESVLDRVSKTMCSRCEGCHDPGDFAACQDNLTSDVDAHGQTSPRGLDFQFDETGMR